MQREVPSPELEELERRADRYVQDAKLRNRRANVAAIFIGLLLTTISVVTFVAITGWVQ